MARFERAVHSYSKLHERLLFYVSILKFNVPVLSYLRPPSEYECVCVCEAF